MASRSPIRTYSVERRFKVCRENGWRIEAPGEWAVVGSRPDRAAAGELLAALEAFNLLVENGSVAEYRLCASFIST